MTSYGQYSQLNGSPKAGPVRYTGSVPISDDDLYGLPDRGQLPPISSHENSRNELYKSSSHSNLASLDDQHSSHGDADSTGPAEEDLAGERPCLSSPNGLAIFRLIVYASYIWFGYLFFSLLVEFCSSIYGFLIVRASPAATLFHLFFYCPCLLGIHRVHAFVVYYQVGFYLLSLVGLFAHLSSDLAVRTILLGIGFGSLFTVYATTWVQLPVRSRERPQYGLLTGLVLLLVFRFNHFSLDPLWIHTSFFIFGCVTTVLASVVMALEVARQVAVLRETQGDSTVAHLLRDPDESESSRSRRLSQGAVSDLLPFRGSEYMPVVNGARESANATPVPSAPLFLSVCLSDGDAEFAVDTVRVWLTTALSLGSLLFLFHMFFTGYSTITRWALVEPFPYCILHLLALMLGIWLGNSPVLQTAGLWAVSFTGCVLLHVTEGWITVFGGCLLALTLPQFFLSTVCTLSPRRVGRSLFVGILWYLLLTYLAYAADGGSLLSLAFLRNLQMIPVYLALVCLLVHLGRSAWSPLLSLLPNCCCCLRSDEPVSSRGVESRASAGFTDRRSQYSFFERLCCGSSDLEEPKAAGPVERLNFPPRTVVVCVFLIVMTGVIPTTLVRAKGKDPANAESSSLIPLTPPVGIYVPGHHFSSIPSWYSDDEAPRSKSWLINRYSPSDRAAFRGHPPPRPPVNPNGSIPIHVFRPKIVAVQLNMRQGYDLNGLDSLLGLYHYLNDLQPDIITLEESETNRMACGNRDAIEFLSWKLQLNVFYGVSARYGSRGAAVLSIFPFDSARVVALPGKAETILLDVQVTVDNGTDLIPVHVMTTHFVNDESDRSDQVLRVVDEIGHLPAQMPVLLLGDFQATPEDATLAPLFSILADAAVQDPSFFPRVPTWGDLVVDYGLFRGVNISRFRVEEEQTLSTHKPLFISFYALS